MALRVRALGEGLEEAACRSRTASASARSASRSAAYSRIVASIPKRSPLGDEALVDQ